MIETNKVCPLDESTLKSVPTPENQVIWKMIQNSANDNLMPTLTWFTWVVGWTIVVGGVLAYVIF